MFNFFRCPPRRVVVNELSTLFVQQVEQKKEKPKMIIDITITRPAPKKEKKAYPIKVFTTFVKIGYNQYKIYVDPFEGYEYITIDGERFEVERPLFGSGGWLRNI